MSDKRSLYKSGRDFLRANWRLISDGWESDQAKGVPAPSQEDAPVPDAVIVPLVSAAELQPRGEPFLTLIRERKSRRKFDPAAALSAEELSFLCWAAAGIRDYRPKFSFRTYPSGGARQPLDLFVYVSRVDGVKTGLYRYLPVEHALTLVREGDHSAALEEALRGYFWNAAAVFFWAAVPYRVEWRYGPVSHKFVALDAGHSCQNLYLACESIGAGTCAVGAYDQEKLDAYLGLDGEDRFALYAAPVGLPDSTVQS
ncbi:MAG: SagB/ThcOx family dehydrogenase [Treponemataceae bacterium]